MMGIPIASYLDLAVSLEENTDPHEAEYHILPFLNAYEGAISTARSKTYHWRRLLMPFHPVEPDILRVIGSQHMVQTPQDHTHGFCPGTDRIPFRI
jgi:hypothetical protein